MDEEQRQREMPPGGDDRSRRRRSFWKGVLVGAAAATLLLLLIGLLCMLLIAPGCMGRGGMMGAQWNAAEETLPPVVQRAELPAVAEREEGDEGPKQTKKGQGSMRFTQASAHPRMGGFIDPRAHRFGFEAAREGVPRAMRPTPLPDEHRD